MFFLCVVIGVFMLKLIATDIAVYEDGRQDTYMITCQQAGITYGNCYNVIHGSSDSKFST